jgi:hypothetical protein
MKSSIVSRLSFRDETMTASVITRRTFLIPPSGVARRSRSLLTRHPRAHDGTTTVLTAWIEDSELAASISLKKQPHARRFSDAGGGSAILGHDIRRSELR